MQVHRVRHHAHVLHRKANEAVTLNSYLLCLRENHIVDEVIVDQIRIKLPSDCLRNREFPTTITIRRGDHLEYLPEPDVFHDLAGHVPMHTDPHFAEALVRFGACGHTAVDLAAGIADRQERIQALTSIIRALARMFWFTIEFGLMESANGLKVYGSGLLSSHSEIQHAVESPDVQRFPFQLEWVINQSFEINRYQPLLFWIRSFDHLFELVGQLEDWMKQGKLNHVAAGEPVVNEQDLMSFLEPEKIGSN